MERVYLHLRNNRQSGPFTIGELLQQQLQPSDMIWVEGKSTAWTYLSELELVPFISEVENADHPHTEKAQDEIERKAEELRQRILASPPKSHFQNHPTEVETYSSPYKLDDEIQFVDYRKERKLKKSTAVAELLLTVFVVGIFVMGIYKGKAFLGARHNVENSVGTQLNSGDQHAAHKEVQPTQVALAVPDTTASPDTVVATEKIRGKATSKKLVADSGRIAVKPLTTIATVNQEPKTENIAGPDESAVKKDEDSQVKKQPVVAKTEIKNQNEPVKEKKGFLRGLFKKKKDKTEDEHIEN